MSKYNYFSVHDLCDLAMIYRDCGDYTPRFWDPASQTRYVCTGLAIDSKKQTLFLNMDQYETRKLPASELFSIVEEFYRYDNDIDSFKVLVVLPSQEMLKVTFSGSSNPDKEIYFNVF